MLQLALTVRNLEPEDLADLDWSGGPEHVAAVAEALMGAYSGDVALLAVALPNCRLVAIGAVDFRPAGDAGCLWMLSVHETFQNLGVGTLLIGALEERIQDRRRHRAQITVEQDNPRAAALYRRLGYREVATTLESWPVGGGRTYVTVSTVLERRLPVPPH